MRGFDSQVVGTALMRHSIYLGEFVELFNSKSVWSYESYWRGGKKILTKNLPVHTPALEY